MVLILEQNRFTGKEFASLCETRTPTPLTESAHSKQCVKSPDPAPKFWIAVVENKKPSGDRSRISGMNLWP